jgi:hypothetical protein
VGELLGGANEYIQADIPLWEKIVIGSFACLFIAIGFFCWKALPKIIDQRSEKIATDHEVEVLKISKNAEALEIESNAMIKEVSSKIEKIFGMLKENDGKLGDIANEMSIDKAKRDERQKTLDKKLDDIETLLDSTSHGSLWLMLKDESMTGKDRARAFLRLLALGVNGRIKTYGMGFVLHHIEEWLNAIEDMKYLKLNIKDQTYFDDVMEEINKKIFDGMMGYRRG